MDDSVVKTLQNFSSETQRVIEYMATNIRPICYDDVTSILSLCNIKFNKLKLILDELRENQYPVEYVKPNYGNRQEYALNSVFSLRLLAHLVSRGKYKGERQLPTGHYARFSNSVSEKFYKFLSGLPVDEFTSFELADEHLENAIRTSLSIDLYDGIEKLIPDNFLCDYFQVVTYHAVSYFADTADVDYWYARLNKHFEDNIASKHKIEMTYGIVKILMPGELDKIPAYVTFMSDDAHYMVGMYHLYNGNYDSAAKSFESGLKEAKNYKSVDSDYILPELPLFNYGYALSLILSSTPKLIKRRSVILAKKALLYSPLYVPTYIALSKKVNGNEPIYLGAVTMEYQRIIFLSGVLYVAILKHFGTQLTDEYSKIVSNISKIDSSKYKLIALEIYSQFEEYKPQYDLLVQELGVTSVLSRDKVLSDWERELDKILLKEGTSVAVNEKQSRISYHLTLNNNGIQPILQTTSNGGKTWTKGRNISMKTFREGGVSNMSESDEHISKCVTAYNGWYGSADYAIDLEQAARYLVGNPNVYLYPNIDVAVDVVEIKPEITISVSKRGYDISFNVDDFTKKCRIIKESATRVNILNLSDEDCNTLKALSNIKHLPFEAKDKLLLLLQRLNSTMTVHSDLIDDGGHLRKIKSDSRIVVQLYPVGEDIRSEFYVKPFTSVAPYCRAGVGSKSVMGVIEGEKLQALRDLKEEQMMMDKFVSLIDDFSNISDGGAIYDTPESALQLIDALRNSSDFAIAEWPEGVKYRLTAHLSSNALRLSLKSQLNWFEMEGELQIDEDRIISIKSLFEMMKGSNGRFINIGENEFIALSDKLRKQLTEIEAVALPAKNGVTINKYALPILSDLDGSGCKIKTDKLYKELKKSVERAESMDIEVPRGLKTELRDYQYKGFQWMVRLAEWGAGGCLADDMGLGKTIQSIAMLLRMAENGASFVVCPASVLPNWERELSKFAPSLTCKTLNSASNRAEQVNGAGAYDVVLSTYGLLVTEQKLIADKEWQIVILDEAHTIKNKDTKSSKATMSLQAKFRLILTGTPIQNHLGEIWNLFNFINPGLLGTADDFLHKYITPIVQNKDKVSQAKLKRLMSPFLLRRTKSGVLDELPPKTEIVYRVEMSESERSFYEVIRRDAERMLQEALPSERLKVLAEITKLRMAACNISLVNKNFDFPSSKMEQFASIVEELQQENHTALVFSQFTSHLALVKKQLDTMGINYLSLDGSTPIKERERLVNQFQKGEHTLFLISLKAGGLGLNLTAADYVIHLDPWWNPAIEDQATDRAYRIGQLRPVTVFRLIAKDTIEEKILRLHATKRDLADALLEGADVANALSKDELLFLLQNR